MRYGVGTILTVMYKEYGRRSGLFVESRRRKHGSFTLALCCSLGPWVHPANASPASADLITCHRISRHMHNLGGV
jgi:hypothetical protein